VKPENKNQPNQFEQINKVEYLCDLGAFPLMRGGAENAKNYY